MMLSILEHNHGLRALTDIKTYNYDYIFEFY